MLGTYRKLDTDGYPYRIVMTCGCFDILHIGHIRCLARAKEEGDLLVVGLNSDRSVRELKGPTRPIIPEYERAEMLAYYSFVDYITTFDESSPSELMLEVRPDVFVKGGDWTVDALLKQDPALNTIGAKIVIIPSVEGRSTTKIVERVNNNGS